MTKTEAATTDLCVDVQFNLDRINPVFTDDRYLSAIILGRKDAIDKFEAMYGRSPDLERCTMEIQNHKDRVSIRFEEVPDQRPCGCGCHVQPSEKFDAALENLMADPDIGNTPVSQWKK